MKPLVLAILCCCVLLKGEAQYYLRGEVKNEQGNLLFNAKILLHSKGLYPFNSGSSGTFGIPVSVKADTIVVSLFGYDTLKQAIATTAFQSLILKPLSSFNKNYSSGLMSFTRNLFTGSQSTTVINGAETYTTLVENNFVNAQRSPETGIALNVNSASYSNIRRFINMQSTVPPDGVRIEEMMNYFNLSTIQPDTVAQQFTCNTQLTSCPWNKPNQLLFIDLHAPKLNLQTVAPANLIFLIDVSGSMARDNRLPLLQAAFKMLVQNLRAQDTIGIVTYGGNVGIALKPTSCAEKEKINNIIDSLDASGDTPGAAAIQTAYLLAETIYKPGSNNRVILATDGDFNIGQTSEKELENMVAAHRQSGIYLTCLGVGMGNYKDSKLEMLAKSGNGNFAYIDNLAEAQKILLTEFTKNMYAVADNAYLTVAFDADAVKNYRLIGFDNKKDALINKNAAIEGGEIGSGYSLMAIFEIEPIAGDSVATKQIARLQLHYELPLTNIEQTQNFQIYSNYTSLDAADTKFRFAAAVSMFGSLLKQSKYAANYSWEDVQRLAAGAMDEKDLSQKGFLTLLEKARRIYYATSSKRKK